MLPSEAMIWPMIAHVVLVFFLYILLSVRRVAAVRAGRATVSQFRENLQDPPDSLFVHNNLKNQFELPVLFHVVCMALYMTSGDNPVIIGLAWFFVLSRCVHTYIHVTSNRIRYRRLAFMAGAAALGCMWIWLALWLALN
ncbi:hypothetical protein SAMN05880590_101706 [Rhizobium sp. RU35A]|uniref:MAPEG family protein n=1 Tax=Rhizobium straminoryzae TaxID=1387186 RepID=A0A549TB91_9HYPH|nr:MULTISPECIES: MAPEG family protein [Rhizobium]TRL39147.1 hypothetical protein FNA46_10275 [Rhizobium straminoryzae]SIQ00162.1 hypothetical protein SAMN05880590_101706 [Rhizobium sp. RU35A]